MSYLALYRKWRPLLFEDIVEQEHVVKTLRNSVKTGRISHAYLFCGSRGTGKTTMAHILSRAINCLAPADGNPCNKCEICLGILDGSILDVLEIDAASNNSVENIREIREEVVYIPSRSKYKVYIIDEVHMLSTGAFNALLKTLEEPPPQVVFILATTEPHKVPQTIISRCQRYDFRKISAAGISRLLSEIAGASDVEITGDALNLIARLSEGALRDAIGILDQCIMADSGTISYDKVLRLMGMVNEDTISDMVDNIISRDIAGTLRILNAVNEEGKDLSRFIADMIQYYRNMLICASADDVRMLIDAPSEVQEKIRRQSALLGHDEIVLSLKELSAVESSLKWSSNTKIAAEVALIKLSNRLYSPGDTELAERLAALEKKIEMLQHAGVFKAAADAGPSNVEPSDTESSDTRPSDAGSSGARPNVAGSSPAVNSMPTTATDKPMAPSDKPAAAANPNRRSVSGAKSVPVAKPMPTAGTVTGSKQKAPKKILFWNEIIHELRSDGKMLLFANLMDTSAYELDDRTVGIVFPNGTGLKKTLISKPVHMAAVEQCLKNKLGREIRIKCLDKDIQIPESAPAAANQTLSGNAGNSGNAANTDNADNGNSGDDGDNGDFVEKALKFAKRIDIQYNNNE